MCDYCDSRVQKCCKNVVGVGVMDSKQSNARRDSALRAGMVATYEVHGTEYGAASTGTGGAHGRH